MPQVTVYVRDEDLPKWKSVEKKSEWLHNKLNNEPSVTKLSPEEVDAYEKISGFKTTGEVTQALNSDKIFKEVEKLYEPVKPFVPRPPDPETGYACCLKRAPCKHWYFDGVSGAWTNELTGKTREVT